MGVAVVHVGLQGMGVHVSNSIPEHDAGLVRDAVVGRRRGAGQQEERAEHTGARRWRRALFWAADLLPMAASGWNLLADLVSDTQAVQVPPSADLQFLARYINGAVQCAV